MRLAIFIGLLAAVFVAARCADLLHRVQSPDMVAVAFAEGGDDGYYVFTIARNIGSGHGVTIDGVNWTSGFQPLWTILCSLPYTVVGDRGALAIIYVASISLWLTSAFLLLRIVREATGKAISPVATAIIVALFLCETHLSQNYINGLETGLYMTLCLVLMLAFQKRLDRPSGSWGEAARLGALCGLTMLARNDAVFVCATLIGVTLLAGDWRRSLREACAIVLVATVFILPWLAYCYSLSGDPMPQSGIATSIALREGGPSWMNVLHSLVLSAVPMLVVKTKTIIDGHWLVVALAALTFTAGAVVLRRWWMPATTYGFRLALAGFAAGTALLVAYYVVASWAGFFFDRYFVPMKLIVVLLIALAVAHAFDRKRSLASGEMAVAVLTIVAIASNLYWVWRDYYVPFRGYMGEQVYAIARSPYAKDGVRLGLAESGRIGFLYPDRVVNLDGKMRVDALRSLRDRKIGEFIRSHDFDYLLLHWHDEEFFDKLSPDWRKDFLYTGKLDTFDVFAKAVGR